MTPDQLDVIEQRAAAATVGPWSARFLGPQNACIDGGGETVASCFTVHGRDTIDDAEFIAAARTDVPALVAEVRRLSGAWPLVPDKDNAA